jgi:Fic family protein
LTVAQAVKHLGTTTRTAQIIIEKLVNLGILREATGKPRNRVFVASHIIQIIEAQSVD